MFKLIGLTGVAQSGKDTAAKVLIDKCGFTRIAYADALRTMLYALNPIVHEVRNGIIAREPVRVSDLVDIYGWEGAKQEPEVRELLQRLGTEAGRAILGDNIWIDTAFKEFDKSKFGALGLTPFAAVITDVRFANEAKAIYQRAGTIVKVERPGVGPVNSHISDAGIPAEMIGYTVVNDGTVDDLHNQILAIVRGDQNAIRRNETNRP